MSNAKTAAFEEAILAGTQTAAPSTAVASATGGYSFSNIKTAATTVVKSGAGTLHSITINTKGTVASAVVVYNNTAGSGATIASIDSLNQSGTYTYDLAFSVGLTIISTGTIAPDITVSYK